MRLGKRLAAQRAAREIRELDMGHGQYLKFRLPDTRVFTMRTEALAVEWRSDNNLPVTAPLSATAGLTLSVLALNELSLVGWRGIVDEEGNEIPDLDDEGNYDAATGYDLLSFEDVGLKLLTEIAKMRQQIVSEAAEGKKASSSRSGGKPARVRTRAKSKRGGGATKKSTSTAKSRSRRSTTVKHAAEKAKS